MKEYTIYSDGSCRKNGSKDNVGAYAYIILDENKEIIEQNAFSQNNTTNNRMELLGAITGIKKVLQIKEDENFICKCYIDSSYITNCYKDSWYKNWLTNNWINSKKQPVKNKDLWERLIPYFNDKRFEFIWVHGHTDDYHNNFVDNLAQTCSKNNINGSGA